MTVVNYNTKGLINRRRHQNITELLKNYWNFRSLFPRALINLIKGKPFSASFDITKNCNCRCPYCYFFSQPESFVQEDLSDEKLLVFIKNVRKHIPVLHATFIGGEPTLRPRVLKEAVTYFPHSWIVTNGTRGFDLARPDCWVWSLDGTKEIHNSIKGRTRSGKTRDVFSKSINSLSTATAPVITNTNVNKITAPYIEEFVHYMAKTSVKGVFISFYTYISSQDKSLTLTTNERKKVLYKLYNLRKEYGDFILTTNSMLYYFNPDNGLNKWNVPNKCPIAKYSRSFTSNGKMQPKCALGNRSVCSSCGVGMVPLYLSLLRIDLSTWKWFLKVI